MNPKMTPDQVMNSVKETQSPMVETIETNVDTATKASEAAVAAAPKASTGRRTKS